MFRSVFRAGESMFDRILCVVGAVTFSQFPEFVQQYQQRLGGRLDEARHQLQQFETTARQAGLSLTDFIGRTNATTDPAVARLGGVMTSTRERVAALEHAQSALHSASIVERPFVFLRSLDTEIARGTWSIFKPAVPTTAEG